MTYSPGPQVSGGGRIRAPRSKEPTSVLGSLALPHPFLCHIISFPNHSPPLPFPPHSSLPHHSVPSFCCSPISYSLYSLFPTSSSLLISPSYLPTTSSPPLLIPLIPSSLPSSFASLYLPSLLSIFLLLLFISFLHTSHPFIPEIPIVSTRKKIGNGDYADLTSGPPDRSIALL